MLKIAQIPYQTFPAWFYKPIISHFSNKMHLLAYRSLPVRVCIFSAQRLDGTNGKMKSNRKPKKFSSQPADSESRKSPQLSWAIQVFLSPLELRLLALSVQFYLDDQDLDFGTWLTIIWLKPTQWCDVKICYSIRTKKNGKGTQGLQRGAFVVQQLSEWDDLIGGNKKNPPLLNLVQISA